MPDTSKVRKSYQTPQKEKKSCYIDYILNLNSEEELQINVFQRARKYIDLYFGRSLILIFLNHKGNPRKSSQLQSTKVIDTGFY